MRHSLMRIWHATGLDVRWYVPAGDPSVFNITKRKFHNVLQGVADKDVLLHEDEMTLFEAWTKHNYERLWAGEDSPIKRLDVAVIDDPQRALMVLCEDHLCNVELTRSGPCRLRAVTALIPIIKRESPRTKIVFRSHIQSASLLSRWPCAHSHRVFRSIQSAPT